MIIGKNESNKKNNRPSLNFKLCLNNSIMTVTKNNIAKSAVPSFFNNVSDVKKKSANR